MNLRKSDRVAWAGALGLIFHASGQRLLYRESHWIYKAGGGRDIFVRDGASAQERTAPLETSPLPVIDAGFDAFIHAHWDNLNQGAGLTVPLVLPSRLGTLDFRISRQPDTRLAGHAARVYRIGLASMIGFALPHLEVSYDDATREPRRFDGVANIRGDNGKNVNVQIELAAATGGTQAQIEQASKAPPDGRCAIR